MNKATTFTIMLLTFLVSACSPGRASNKINVEVTDFAFTPNHFTLQAGQQTTVHVTHSGLVEHDFVLMKLGTEVGGHFDEEDLVNIYWQVKIQPGESSTVTFTAPEEPGIYQIVCGMAGHIEAGMVGTLEVVE